GVGERLGVADLELVDRGHLRRRQLRIAPEEPLDRDPDLPNREGGAGQHDELHQLTPRHVVVAVPIDREVLTPLRLVCERRSVGRNGSTHRSAVEGGFFAHASTCVSNTSSRTSCPMVGSCIAAVTSMCSWAASFGTMTLALVRIVWAPN